MYNKTFKLYFYRKNRNGTLSNDGFVILKIVKKIIDTGSIMIFTNPHLNVPELAALLSPEAFKLFYILRCFGFCTLQIP